MTSRSGVTRRESSRTIAPFTRTVLARYDHRNWNDVLEFPSVENICALISGQLRERISFPMVIRVWEGRGKWAEMEVKG